MNSCVPRLCSAEAALQTVLGKDIDPADALAMYAYASDDMVAVLVEGDWISTNIGPVVIPELFPELSAQVPDDKVLCAIVVTGNLTMDKAVLIDFDTDWSPSLIVGGDVVAQSLCLGGGQTQIIGQLKLHDTLYGHYNHGSLEVGGATRAQVILSSDFAMRFHGKVDCRNVLSSNGTLNITVHRQDDALAQVLVSDLLSSHNTPIHENVLQMLAQGQTILAPNETESVLARLKRLLPGSRNKTKRPALSKAGRERLAEVVAGAQRGEKIHRLDFSSCDLKFVPEEIAAFTEVTHLSLEGNRIPELPDWLARWHQLEVLNISDCALTDLPDWLGQLPKLRELYATGNDLVALPAFAGAFPMLEELRLGNSFTSDPEHAAWLCSLRLAQFPVLRKFCLNLNVTGTIYTDAVNDVWYSTTLEHLDIVPDLKGTLPTCLARMPQLKSLDIQLEGSAEAVAYDLLAQLGQLEALQFSYGGLSDTFIKRVATALPSTFIRCNTLTRKKSLVDVFMNEASPDEVLPDISGLIYREELDEALICVNREIARVEADLPAVSASDIEYPLRQKLDILTRMAQKVSDLPAKRAKIETASLWATDVLARYRSLSADTIWQLGFELGTLRIECLLTQAWWLIRRESPDFAAATDLLNQTADEIQLHVRHKHVSQPLEQRIASLRKVMNS